MPKATSRSVNKSAISTIVAVILTAIIAGSVVGGAVYAYFALQFAPAQQLGTQPKPALQKFKVISGRHDSEFTFLPMDTGRERGIFASNGLDPEFVPPPPGQSSVTAVTITEHVAAGIKIGVAPNLLDVLTARSRGVPVKIVASYAYAGVFWIFVRGDSPLRTVNDLDGKKVGIQVIDDFTHRNILRLSKQFGIKPEILPVGNITNMVVALKLGKIDAFASSATPALRLVDSGELRIVYSVARDLPKEYAHSVVFTTEDLIQQNPELVKSFVKAWLEAVRYLKEHSDYAADIYVRRTNAPRDLAEKAVLFVDLYTPSGRGRGLDLVAGVANRWEAQKAEAVPPGVNVKIEDAVDVRFLP